ncbi:MAG: TorF family putative porin [Gammaproteobacteria bacterium]
MRRFRATAGFFGSEAGPTRGNPGSGLYTAQVLCRGIILLLLLVYSCAGVAETHGTFTLTSDYVWRGYSKSAQGTALQANLDYEVARGFYLGSSASTVDFGDHAFADRSQVEITPYLGWSTPLAEDWRLDLQWTRYFYDGKIFGRYSDYNEFYGFLHYRDLASLAFSFSDDFYQRGHVSGNFELNARYPLSDWLEVSSSAGYSLTKHAVEYDYLYWNLGFSVYFDHLVLDFRYADAMQTDSVPVDPTRHAEEFLETLKPTLIFLLTIGF